MFNKVLKAKVTLRNTGIVEFTYVVPGSSTGTAAKPLPGVPLVLPTTVSSTSHWLWPCVRWPRRELKEKRRKGGEESVGVNPQTQP